MQIKGTVLVFESIPIVEANINVLGTSNNVKTNDLGEFTIVCQVKDKLVITADGFNEKKCKIKSDKRELVVFLNLSNDVKAAEIAISKGHIKNMQEFSKLVDENSNIVDFSNYESALQIIKAKYSGVSIENDGVVIRGKKSLQGSSNALIEVDGIILDFNALTTIPTSTIKSLNILSSSSSGSYGSRGANGVVVIKTKEGI